MKAKNTSKGPFHLESGDVAVGDCGEFTDAEFKFLSGMGRAEMYVAPPKKKAVKKPAAPTAPEGFM